MIKNILDWIDGHRHPKFCRSCGARVVSIDRNERYGDSFDPLTGARKPRKPYYIAICSTYAQAYQDNMFAVPYGHVGYQDGGSW